MEQFDKSTQDSELKKLYEAKQLAFLKWDGTKGKNIRDAPGLENHIQIGQAAIDRANQERMGTGALRLSDGGASGYAEKMKAMRQAEMGNQVGASLEQALGGLRAEANGSVLPLAQMDMNRSMGLVGMASQNNNAYMNRPRQTPFWQTLLMGAISGGSQVATGFTPRG